MRRKVLFIAFLIFVLTSFADAQFNSGSTGADGALDASTMTCPSNVCTVQLPESGILNYTTVNIPAGKTLTFIMNSRNTPVIMLATGEVTILGSISLSGEQFGTVPGPGGFYGGRFGINGQGPGGGILGSAYQHGKWVGPLSLTPITGGSGGAGTCNESGGGGGGAIVIASSTNIVVNGSLIVNGGQGYCFGGGTFGSGGAIRLVSNTISGSGNLSAASGGGVGSYGIIRIEAPTGQRNFTGTANPTAIFADVNPVVIPVNPPVLTITSVGGYAVPSYSAGNPNRIDVMLPSQLTDPIIIGIQGSNIPSGTQVQLQLAASSGTVTGCALAGGPGPVACDGSVSGLSRTGVATLLAYAVYTPTGSLAKYNPKGKNHVAKVRLEAALASKTRYVFLRSNGTTVDHKLLKPQFLKEFGM